MVLYLTLYQHFEACWLLQKRPFRRLRALGLAVMLSRTWTSIAGGNGDMSLVSYFRGH